MAITKAKRKEIETLIYNVFDKMDKTKTNSEHYAKIFAPMSDEQFVEFLKLDFPFRFHHKPFEIEPKMSDCFKAAKLIKLPILEKLDMPYMYKNADGIPPTTQECLVGYTHIKRVQQFITKKNSMSVDISQRDMKTGLLTSGDRNGKTSDREFESLAIMGLDNTMKEFSTAKADAMNAKSAMYGEINTTGMVYLKDIPNEMDDSLSKNLMDAYLIGSHVMSNLVSLDYETPYTLKERNKQVVRI